MCKNCLSQRIPTQTFSGNSFKKGVVSVRLYLVWHCVGGGGGVTSFLSFICPGAAASAAEKEARLDLLLSRFPEWLPFVFFFGT